MPNRLTFGKKNEALTTPGGIMQPGSNLPCRSAIGRPLIFKCPNTFNNVQHWLEGEEATDYSYESIICPACAGLHFINRKTGSLLGRRGK